MIVRYLNNDSYVFCKGSSLTQLSTKAGTSIAAGAATVSTRAGESIANVSTRAGGVGKKLNIN